MPGSVACSVPVCPSFFAVTRIDFTGVLISPAFFTFMCVNFTRLPAISAAVIWSGSCARAPIAVATRTRNTELILVNRLIDPPFEEKRTHAQGAAYTGGAGWARRYPCASELAGTIYA